MSRRQFIHTYQYIISVENILAAWQEFLVGKRSRHDVQQFELDLVSNILSLHHDLADKTYRHGSYERFNISDPKPRIIHKASVRDRLLHHAIYRQLYPFFDRTFIADSYSCRIGKGTHKALNRFQYLTCKVSENNTKTVWVLKCDVKKFFASIDHETLLNILGGYIANRDILALLKNVVDSFHTQPSQGLPLGNLTSQLFVNVYMNEFDQFVKHDLKARHYIRYADDFVMLASDRHLLEDCILKIKEFLRTKLSLTLHPKKVSIEAIASGIDFLGWVHFPDHRVLRTTSKRRMIRRLQEHPAPETLQSYLGLLQHGNTKKLQQRILNDSLLWSGK